MTTPGASASRGPVVAAFVALGAFWGLWAVSLANVQHTFGLSNAALGALLAVAIGVAGATNVVVGHRAERWGTRRLLIGALAVWSLLLVAMGLASPFAVFAVAFVGTEVAGGCVDVGMNAASTQLLMGRPGALVRFHALFNAGALLGAAAAGLALHAGISWRWLYPCLGVAAAVTAAWTATVTSSSDEPLGPAPLPSPVGEAVVAGPDPETGGPAGSLQRLRMDGLATFLVIFAVAEMVEGGVDTWGVLFLRTQLGAGVLLGAGAYAVGQGVAVLTRGGGGPLLGRLSPTVGLLAGAGVVGAGLAVLSVAPVGLAAAGLAAGAAGASLFWPLVMSDVAGRASRPTSAVGAFTAAGYVGWVAGAPLVGWVADTWGLERGVQLLAALALVVAAAALVRGRRGPLRAPAE